MTDGDWHLLCRIPTTIGQSRSSKETADQRNFSIWKAGPQYLTGMPTDHTPQKVTQLIASQFFFFVVVGEKGPDPNVPV